MAVDEIIGGQARAMQSWFPETLRIFRDGALYGAHNPLTRELLVPAQYESLSLHRVGEKRIEVVVVGHQPDERITVHESDGAIRFGPIALFGETLSPLKGLIAANDEAMVHALGIWGQSVELCSDPAGIPADWRVGDQGEIGYGLPPGYLVGLFSFDREVPVTRLSRQDPRRTLGIAFDKLRLIRR